MSKIAQEMQRFVEERRKLGRSATIEEIALRPKPRGTLKRKPLKASPKTKAKKREQSKVVATVREEVFALDPKCISGLHPPSLHDQMHELVSRAKTRGRPPKDRFSTKNCVRLSPATHADVTENRCVITWADDRMANGVLTLTWKTGRIVTYRRNPDKIV